MEKDSILYHTIQILPTFNVGSNSLPSTMMVKIMGINEDLKSLKTTGPKVVGQLDKKATKKQVNDAVKQLQTAQIKLKGVLDETALKQQISKVKADADVNVTGSEKIKELQENMDKAGDSANAMAAKLYLARTALQALQKAAHEAIETVTELDKAATTLAIVTGGKSGEAYDLIAQYNELAKQLGATTVQVSDAATSWLRQGKTTAETAELIEQSMILSKVAMVDSANLPSLQTFHRLFFSFTFT